MNCPDCESKTRVVDSRRVELVVARKRECLECGRIFYTEEIEVEDHEAIKYYQRVIKARQRAKL